MTFDEVNTLLSYDPQTGLFTWKRGRRAGKIAGCFNKRGYLRISLKRRGYQGHWIAWLLTYGQWPTSVIDHINGNPSDNRICNLRVATTALNTANSRVRNQFGLKGIFPHYRDKWRAQITVDGKTIYLGTYNSPEEASAAYMTAARLHFGDYARAL